MEIQALPEEKSLLIHMVVRHHTVEGLFLEKTQQRLIALLHMHLDTLQKILLLQVYVINAQFNCHTQSEWLSLCQFMLTRKAQIK